MDKKSLKEQLAKVEADFNDLEKQRQQIETRMAELRGQYQLLQEQLNKLDDKKNKVSPAADVIDADAALKE